MVKPNGFVALATHQWNEQIVEHAQKVELDIGDLIQNEGLRFIQSIYSKCSKPAGYKKGKQGK